MKTVTSEKGAKTPFAKDQPQGQTMPESAKQAAAEAGIPIDYSGDEGAGFERGKHKVSDFKVPFLTIVQDLSPQRKETDAKYDENVKSGMVVNTGTGKVVEARKSKNAGLIIVPLDRITEYPEWKPKRGGLVTVHLDAAILKQTKKGTGNESNWDILPNGNVIDTTSKWFVMLLTDEGFMPCVIAMARSNLKHSRAWLTKLDAMRYKRADGSIGKLPMYAKYWTLSTVPELKDNNTFFTWDMEEGDLVKKPEAYQELKDTRESVVSGQLALPDSGQVLEAEQSTATHY